VDALGHQRAKPRLAYRQAWTKLEVNVDRAACGNMVAMASKRGNTRAGSGRIKQVMRQDPRLSGWQPDATGVH